MKYCEEYAALLDLFVDGELSGDEMERVRAHLASCPGCQAYVDDAMAIRTGFPGVEDTVVPEGFAGGVMERVRAASGRKTEIVELKRRSIRRWVGCLAATAACCALVFSMRGGVGRDGTAVISGGASGGAAGVSSAPSYYSIDSIESAEEDVESGITAQMEPEEPAAMPESENKEIRMTAQIAGAANDTAKVETYGEAMDSQAAAAAPKAAQDIVEEQEAAREAAGEGGETVLRLTAEESGNLLDSFTPVSKTSGEWKYELNRVEYQALLEALGRLDDDLNKGEMFAVVVVKPLE